jgi:two-component system NtrC family sensor kinase
MKVLVVEASKESRMRVVNAMCELDGVVVQGAVGNFGDAVRALDKCSLDAVITGTELPDGDVEGLIAAARRRHLATVVVLASEDPPARARFMSAGATHVVTARLDELASWLAPETSALDERAQPFALIGRLSAGVAHDINNYLTAANVALAFAEHPTMPPEAREELGRARAAFGGISRLVDSLTTYARGGSPAPTALDLAELVRGTLDTFRHVVPHGVHVVVESEAGLPLVQGVRAELEQLVLNLVINACDAMPWGGKLWAIVERAGPGELRLEITDTGSGVIEEIVAGIGVTSPSNRHGATRAGLGLGVVRTVVDRHHGTLRIGRRNSGGTSVVVGLPAISS